MRNIQGKELGRTGVVDLEHKFAAPSPDGRLLAVAGDSRTVTLWDVIRRRVQTRFEHPGRDPGRLQFSPDGRDLACEFKSGNFVIHDLSTGACHSISPGTADPDMNIRRVFRDSRLLARSRPSAADRPQPTQIWQIKPWREIASYPGVPRLSETHVFSRDGRSHFARWVTRRSAGISHRRENALSPPAMPTRPGRWRFPPIARSWPRAAMIRTSRRRSSSGTWPLARKVRGWDAGGGTVSALAFHPTGRVLASGHLGTPGEVRLWDPESGQTVATLSGHSSDVRTLAFSPDGYLLATAGSDQTVRLWDVQTRRCLRVLSGHTDAVRYLCFSPDGTRLATAANDKSVKIWDVASGRAVSQLPWVEKIAGVSYTRDGKRLATADETG